MILVLNRKKILPLLKEELNVQYAFFDKRQSLMDSLRKFADKGQLHTVPTHLLSSLPVDLRVLYEEPWRKQIKLKITVLKIAMLRVYQKEFDHA